MLLGVMTCYSLYAEERKGWVKIQVQNFHPYNAARPKKKEG